MGWFGRFVRAIWLLSAAGAVLGQTQGEPKDRLRVLQERVMTLSEVKAMEDRIDEVAENLGAYRATELVEHSFAAFEKVAKDIERLEAHERVMSQVERALRANSAEVRILMEGTRVMLRQMKEHDPGLVGSVLRKGALQQGEGLSAAVGGSPG